MSDLPQPNEPLVLTNGIRIDPTNGKVVRATAPRVTNIPSPQEAQRIVARTRRKLADLPAPPRTSNALSVVLTYTLAGLNDEDIAIACSLTVEQVTTMRASQAYQALEKAVVDSVLSADLEDIRGFLQQNARTAAQRVTELINSEDDQISLTASKDILDRTGNRAADIVEHRHRVEGGLVLEIIERGDPTALPTIDITPEK